jgi:uncharacterized protein (TIGR02453 family)
MKTTIQPATFHFLTDLKNNNNREWFAANKEPYTLAKDNFHAFVQALIVELTSFDKSLDGLEASKCVFRIFRDVRFGHDKTPYKTNFAATLKGRGNGLAGYYLQLAPGGTFLAGGLYGPEPAVLKAIRQELVYNGTDFLKILNHKTFKKELKFEGSKLQKLPSGFDKEDAMAEYLKYKDFTVFHAVDDAGVLDAGFLLHCAKVCKVMGPFNAFLNAPAQEIKPKQKP